MELKNLKELKVLLCENLRLVFSSNELIEHINDEIFFKLILKLISFLYEIETKLNVTKKTSEKMLSGLNVITKKNNTFMDVDIDEYFQVKDEINYLDVYLYNIYKKHLKDFVSDINLSNNDETKKAIINAPNTSSLDIPQDEKARNIDTPYKPNDSPSQSIPFNTSTNNSNININPEIVQEQIYYQIANQKISEEMKSGVFYVYDSKPKIVPIVKKIFYTLFCVNGLIFLLPFLAHILSAGLIIPQWNREGVRIEDGRLGIDAFTTVVYLMFSIFSLFYGVKNLLKKEKNENLIYYFNWYFFIIIGVFFAFSLFNLIGSFSTSFKYLPEIIEKNWLANPNKLMWYQIYLYSTVASYSFLGFMCLMAIFMSFLNPKKDINRINEKISQYIKEIKRQQQQQK